MATSVRITRLTTGKIEILLAKGNLRRSISTRTTRQLYSIEACQPNVARQFGRLKERKWMRICSINSCGPCRAYCTTENQNPPPVEKEAKESTKVEENGNSLQAETLQATSDADQTHEVSDMFKETGREEVAETKKAEAHSVDQNNLIQTEVSQGDGSAGTAEVDKIIIKITPTSESVEDNITTKQDELASVVSETTGAPEVVDDVASVSANRGEDIQAEHIEQAPIISETESTIAVETPIEADSVQVNVEEATVSAVATPATTPDTASLLNDPADKLDDVAPVLKDSASTLDDTAPVNKETKPVDKPADTVAVSQHDSDDAASTTAVVEDTDEVDILYKKLILEVKCHDRKVLHSYDQYMRQTAKLLDLRLANVTSPKMSIYRQSVLKSAHIYKKHQAQYEERTYYRVFEFKHLTGSTATTLLEYVQRNLPEGAAMKVTRHQILPMPAHLKPPKQRKELQS